MLRKRCLVEVYSTIVSTIPAMKSGQPKGIPLPMRVQPPTMKAAGISLLRRVIFALGSDFSARDDAQRRVLRKTSEALRIVFIVYLPRQFSSSVGSLTNPDHFHSEPVPF